MLAGVHIQCLDERKEVIPGVTASGFIRREGEGLYLYTCWHVVVGLGSPQDLNLNCPLPTRRHIRLSLWQGDSPVGSRNFSISGPQTLDLPLYDAFSPRRRPLWLQENAHVPNPDLNAIGLYAPYSIDAVKIRLPDELRVASAQTLDEDRTLSATGLNPSPGEQCLVIGFPYGYKAFDGEMPYPIGLTRFFASRSSPFYWMLLDSPATAGMSGGPVMLERDGELLLMGIYTGARFPDYGRGTNEKSTALGLICNLRQVFSGRQLLVETPSQAVEPLGKWR